MAVFKVAAIGEDGKYFDDFALTDVINYVVNRYKTPSRLIGTFGVRLEYAAQQMELVSRAYNNYQKLRLRHWIISFGDRDLINPIEAYYIAVEAAKFYADRYQLVFAVHEDTDQVHERGEGIEFARVLVSAQNHQDRSRHQASEGDPYTGVVSRELFLIQFVLVLDKLIDLEFGRQLARQQGIAQAVG